MNNGSHPSIAIIGSQGRMGAMLSKRFAEAGFPVKGVDIIPQTAAPEATETLVSAVAHCHIVMLCVPAGALEAVLKGLAPLLRPDQLLMDITSVKSIPMALMEKAHQGPVIGSHPLFGPEPLPEDMRTILVQGKNASAKDCRMAEQLFSAITSRTHWATAEEHDKGVAIAQTLNFTVSAAFFCTLAEERNIRPFLTPSFKRHLEAARKHLTIDTAMFLEFSAMNPFCNTALDAYITTLERVKKGDLPQVAHQAQQWYALNEQGMFSHVQDESHSHKVAP